MQYLTVRICSERPLALRKPYFTVRANNKSAFASFSSFPRCTTVYCCRSRAGPPWPVAFINIYIPTNTRLGAIPFVICGRARMQIHSGTMKSSRFTVYPNRCPPGVDGLPLISGCNWSEFALFLQSDESARPYKIRP